MRPGRCMASTTPVMPVPTAAPGASPAQGEEGPIGTALGKVSGLVRSQSGSCDLIGFGDLPERRGVSPNPQDGLYT